MSDLPEWGILAVAGVIVILAVMYGIECIRYANGTIRRCKEIRGNTEKEYLDAHPLCVVCQSRGRYRKATQIWIETNGNWQSRCHEHMESKLL